MANNLLNAGLSFVYHENRFRNGYTNSRNVIRNKIINGGMNVAQRGTSFSIPRALPDNSYNEENPPFYTLDRWFALANVSANVTITQENTDSELLPPIGFDSYMKISTSANPYTLGPNDVFAVGQYIDYQTYSYSNNGLANQLPITLSFLAFSECE